MSSCISKRDLIARGFLELAAVKDLRMGLKSSDLREELASCGVYAIVASEDYEPKFLSGDEVNKEKIKVRKHKSIDELKRKWVEGTEVLYIGCAGVKRRSLRKRLRDLVTHFEGRTTEKGPHKGGEIIWQLEGSEEFQVLIKPTGGPPEPKRLESNLLIEFIKVKGKLPFANRKLEVDC